MQRPHLVADFQDKYSRNQDSEQGGISNYVAGQAKGDRLTSDYVRQSVGVEQCVRTGNYLS